MILPVDQQLLKIDHLNAWRDLRTVDIVMRHNKDSFVYQKRVEDLVNKMMKTSPSQRISLHRNALEWSDLKVNRPLGIVFYYLTQLLKIHLPESAHEEIETLPEEIKKYFKATYFQDGSLARDMVDPFMDDSMQSLVINLLMEWLYVDYRSDHHNSVNHRKYILNTTIPKSSQIYYAGHYLCYMKLIEKIEVLEAAAIQDIDLIKRFPMKGSLTSARKLFGREASQPHITRNHLLNNPYDQYRPIKFPLLEYPSKIKGESSANIEFELLRFWSYFSVKHVKIASELSNISGNTSNEGTTFPARVRAMHGYHRLRQNSSKQNSGHHQMWTHIAKTINLVSDLDKPDSAEQSILWQILRSALNVMANNFDPKNCERQIENSVMFYLLLRRLGEVLEVIMEKHCPSTCSDGRCTRAQFMMYYWSLMSYKSTGDRNKQEKTNEWMQFKLGRVYLNHLISAQELNKLYHQMQTTNLDALDMDPQKGISVSHSKMLKAGTRHEHRIPNQSESDFITFGSDVVYPDYALETQPHESKSSTSVQRAISYSDRMNFQVPRKRSSRYPKSITTTKSSLKQDVKTLVPTSPQKRISVEKSLESLDQTIPTGFQKKPRTKTLVISSLASVSHWPSQNAGPITPFIAGVQNTLHHQSSILKDTGSSQESNTGGEQATSVQIVVNKGDTSDIKHLNTNPLPQILAQQCSDHIYSLDLNKPWECASGNEGFGIMLPDLNIPWEPI
ncbi:hypothetical protein DFH28DRAFT_944777 [Melampsora americana]|nr:hypothetical protein DFH28DRAFT_944777 [Melampsora americana]